MFSDSHLTDALIQSKNTEASKTIISSQLTVSDVTRKQPTVAAQLLALDLLGEHNCVYTQMHTCTTHHLHTHIQPCLPEGHFVSWEHRGQGGPSMNREQKVYDTTSMSSQCQAEAAPLSLPLINKVK